METRITVSRHLLIVIIITFLISIVISAENKQSEAVNTKPDINGYSFIVIPDAQSDPYEIGIALREVAKKLGFTVYISGHDIARDEASKTCIALWGWSRVGAYSGTLQMRFYDAITNNLIKEVHSKATVWMTKKGAVTRLAEKAFKRSGYTHYNEKTHQDNLKNLFPPRPKMDFGEKGFEENPPQSDIEGVWSDNENQYTVAITRAGKHPGFDYVGIIVSSNNPLWSPGEIKMELKKTVAQTVLIGNYYPSNKKRQGTTYMLDHGALLKFTFRAGGKDIETYFIKSWPAQEGTDNPKNSKKHSSVSGTGTGFLISSDGLVATNWHVVDGAEKIDIQFPWQLKPSTARVVIKDPANDLAILQIIDFDSTTNPCANLPYQLVKASSTKIGEKIYTIGYPLEGLLGAGPKYTEGVVSGTTGLMDDVRCLQISAAIQPGNSGSPLIDSEGNVIGIIVSSLSPAFQYKLTKTLPQNVNFAIKADYLINLLEMLPNKPTVNVKKVQDASSVSRCIGVVKVTSE